MKTHHIQSLVAIASLAGCALAFAQTPVRARKHLRQSTRSKRPGWNAICMFSTNWTLTSLQTKSGIA